MLVLVMGCGRIAFDPITDGAVRPDDGPDPDGNGATVVACDAAAPFTSIRELTELNTNTVDGALRLTSDELVAFFHTTRNPVVFEIWTASRSLRTLPFDPPALVLTPNFQWPHLASDRLTLVYNQTNGNLYSTTRGSTTDVFVPGSPLAAVNTADVEASPVLSGTGTALYFTRFGGADVALQVAAWPSLSPARALVELTIGASVPQAPALSPDERVIYFASGAGLDIYVASRADLAQPFGAPTLVPELSTAAVESPTWISPDLCRLYFERKGPNDFDLFVAERVP
jgi:hypothetical protein